MVELLAPDPEMEDYTFESAKKICGNVAGLCSWTLAMLDFYKTNKEVLPLKANLKLQESHLGDAQAELSKAQCQLDAKQQLNAVQALYDAAMKEKQDLQNDTQSCRREMVNATALIHGLGGEKVLGLHPNADITCQTNLTNEMLNIVNIQLKDRGRGDQGGLRAEIRQR